MQRNQRSNCQYLLHHRKSKRIPKKASTCFIDYPKDFDYVDQEFPCVQGQFRKGRGTRDQIVNIYWIIKKARELKKKKSTFASLTTLKPLTVWITTNCRENS